ncbi:MAG: hypothetical protein QOF78_2254 [Phycisphaerales bacterium]|nr:hypothetical protein [Phycisphaerales bacterium]
MHVEMKIARRKSRAIAAASMLAAIVAGGRADGANYINGYDSFWSDPNNWSTGQVPRDGGDADVTQPGFVTVAMDYSYAWENMLSSVTVDAYGFGGDVLTLVSYADLCAENAYIGRFGKGVYAQPHSYTTSIGALYLGYAYYSTGTYSLTGPATSTIVGNAYAGYDGIGSFIQSAGTQDIGGSLYVGYSAYASGSYNLSGSGNLAVHRSETIGYAGAGTFTQSGGTHSINPTSFPMPMLRLGDQSGASGSYNLTGGLLAVTGDEFIGYGGAGTFTQSGGTNTLSGELYFGYNAGSTGRYDLSGTGTLAVGADETIGLTGAGTFTQNGGTHTIGTATINRNFNIASQAGSSGRYTLSGNGSLIVHGVEQIGGDGAGTFTQTGGTHTIGAPSLTGALTLAVTTGASGSYALSGAGILTVNGEEIVGDAGTGSFTQTGGTHTIGSNAVAANLSLGWGAAAANGTYNLSGTGVLAVKGSEYVGRRGQGTFIQSGGTHTVGMVSRTGNLFIGHTSGAVGSYTLSGTGSLTVNGNEYVSFGAPGSFTQSGGTHTVGTPAGSGNLFVGWTTTSGSYLLSGGVLNVKGIEYIADSAGGDFTQTGGSHTIGTASTPKQLTLGRLAGAGGSYNLGGSGNLTVNGNEYIGLSGNGSFKQTGGRHAVSGILDVATNPGSSGIFTISAGSLTMGTLQVNANGVFHYNGGTVEPITVQISDSGKVILSPGGGSRTLATYALSLDAASGGLLNLNDHALIVRDGEVGVPDSGVYNGVTGLIQSGFNQGFWDGGGIITGMADATAGLTSLGIATADQTGYSMFGGVSVRGGNVLVMYTYAGDANLDGFISGDDYSTIDFNVGTSADGWYNGDFNYDGIISGDDYSTIDFNYTAQGAPFPTSASADAASVTAVPEPVLAPLIVLFAPLARRRRRRGSRVRKPTSFPALY